MPFVYTMASLLPYDLLKYQKLFLNSCYFCIRLPFKCIGSVLLSCRVSRKWFRNCGRPAIPIIFHCAQRTRHTTMLMRSNKNGWKKHFDQLSQKVFIAPMSPIRLNRDGAFSSSLFYFLLFFSNILDSSRDTRIKITWLYYFTIGNEERFFIRTNIVEKHWSYRPPGANQENVWTKFWRQIRTLFRISWCHFIEINLIKSNQIEFALIDRIRKINRNWLQPWL